VEKNSPDGCSVAGAVSCDMLDGRGDGSEGPSKLCARQRLNNGWVPERARGRQRYNASAGGRCQGARAAPVGRRYLFQRPAGAP
jgi:hypothetical protein